MPSKSCRMSRIESIATPAMPTSPTTRGWSESEARWGGRANATGRPFCPAGGVGGVVAAVGGQVEGDRQALLPGGEVAPVERVGLRRGGETRVLADGPRLGGVHGRVGPAQVRSDARVGAEEVCAQVVDVAQVGRGEQRGDGDALRRLPGRVGHAAAGGLLEGLGPVVRRGARGRAAQLEVAEVGDAAHAFPPSCEKTVRSTSSASHPAYTYPSTPSTPSAGFPASHTCVAPAAFSSAASSAADAA